MSDALANLGGEMGHTGPEPVESHFLDQVPNNPPNKRVLPPSWEQIQSIVRTPKPQKAVGLDSLSLFYLISVLPDAVQRWFCFLTKRVTTLDIPQNWLEAEFFLLPKGGDATSQSNYRPIALLTSIHKIIATHISNYLNAHTAKLGTLSNCQFGFRKKYQTTDHSIALAAKHNLPSTPPLMFYTWTWEPPTQLNFIPGPF